MNYKEISKGILRSVLILSAICLGIFLLNEVQILISYLIIAAVVSLIGRPFVNFFTTRLKLKNTTGSVLTMVILISIVVGIISLFVPLVIEQGKNLSLLDVDSFQNNITFLYSELSTYLSNYNINLDNSIFNIDWLKNIDFTFGITQSIDDLLLKHKTDRLRIFEYEYHYSRKIHNNVKLIKFDSIEKGDWLLISLYRLLIHCYQLI